MKNILLIDDSATSRMLFKAYMPEGSDFNIHEAFNAETAVTLAEKVRPDLIVVDYNMPDKSGIAIVSELRDLHLDKTIIIILTANAQKAIIEEAATAGIHKVFEKPITRELIAQLLKDSLS